MLRRLRRLRQPRYLIGALVGAAYLYLIFFRRVRVRRSMRPAAALLPPAVLGPLQLAGALVLWLVVAARWIVPVSTQPLKLSGPERDILLTAPVGRRRVTRYKLLRSQFAVFLSTALMLLIAWGSVSSAWSFLLGMFLLFTTLRMHLLAASLARAARKASRRYDSAALVAFGVVLIASAGALWVLGAAVLAFARTQNAEAALAAASDVASGRVAALALLPFTLMIRPVIADWPSGFLATVWPVIGIALLNYAWVLRANEMVEESAVLGEHEKAAEGRPARARAVFRPAPFALAPRGRSEWALVWKNLIMLSRYANPVMLLRIGLALVLLAFVVAGSHRHDIATAAAPFAIALSSGLTLLGPYMLRNDLRQDLARLAVLKTWPLSGERLLWGEMLAPSIVLTALVWVCILITAVLSVAIALPAVGWLGRLALAAAAGLLCPAIIVAQVTVQNAAVVLFPGWVAIGPSRPRGVEAMGQQMLMFAGSMLLLAVGILPGAAIGGVVVLLGYGLIGWLAVVPGAALVAGLILGEVVLAVHLLGALLDRTDPTAVDVSP